MTSALVPSSGRVQAEWWQLCPSRLLCSTKRLQSSSNSTPKSGLSRLGCPVISSPQQCSFRSIILHNFQFQAEQVAWKTQSEPHLRDCIKLQRKMDYNPFVLLQTRLSLRCGIDFSQLNVHLPHHMLKRFSENTSCFRAVTAKFTRIIQLSEDAEGEKEESLRLTITKT